MSEPHSMPPTGRIFLTKSDPMESAHKLHFQHGCGEDISINNLEVLDAFLKLIPEYTNSRLIAFESSDGKTLNYDTICRLRFERGLDVR